VLFSLFFPSPLKGGNLSGMNQTPTHHRPNAPLKERLKRYAVGIPIFLAIYVVLILLYLYPHWPIDLMGWFILIVVGIPISLCLEWIGESLLSERISMKISSKKFSMRRIAFSLVVFLLISGVLGFFWFVLSPFVRHHFR